MNLENCVVCGKSNPENIVTVAPVVNIELKKDYEVCDKCVDAFCEMHNKRFDKQVSARKTTTG